MSFGIEINPAKPQVMVFRANDSHASDIYKITKEAFHQYVKDAKIPGTVDAINETVDDILRDIREKVVFIAEADGMPAGSIRITVKADSTAYISRFGVFTKYQSSGIGRALMEESNKFLTSYKIRSVSLHTAANSSLVGFYNQFGFNIEEITHEKGYPRALMKKDL